MRLSFIKATLAHLCGVSVRESRHGECKLLSTGVSICVLLMRTNVSGPAL